MRGAIAVAFYVLLLALSLARLGPRPGFAAAPDPLTAAACAIVVVSPIGLMFGVLWSHTRSLALVVLLHGWADLVPNLADFVRAWAPR